MEEEKQLLILDVNNVSLSVSKFDLPQPKEEAQNMTARNKTRCSQRYAASHCGPVAVVYNLVRLEWETGSVELSEDTVEVTEGNSSVLYSWTEVNEMYLSTST